MKTRIVQLRGAMLFLWLAWSAAGLGAQPTADPVRKSIVETAMTFRGVPYMYGAMSPSAFDCSGFVGYVYRKAAGITLPRSSRGQFTEGTPIDPKKARPGDVLVFDTVGGAPSHVAIILDQSTMIHAASAGPRTGVIVSPLNDKYFAPRLIGARTFLNTPTAEAAASNAASSRPDTAAARAAPAAVADEGAVAIVGFSITDTPTIFADKIPAAAGTAVQFAVKNETARGGVFEILFYKMDLDPSKVVTLRRDRVRIEAGGISETAPIVFAEPGQYRLILKTHDNLKRVERTWRVADAQ